MRLLTKFNLVLTAMFVCGLAGAGAVSHRMLQANAKDQVLQSASLMMETALSARKYTINQVKPLIQAQSKKKFLKETVPAYAAMQTFRYLPKQYAEFTYKEATLNPTNLRDKTTPWEAKIVKLFRRNPDVKRYENVHKTPDGTMMCLARPIRITDKNCLSCHSTPQAAPASMLAIYGSKNGFGWKHNEVVGAQIVSVPMSLPVNAANSAFLSLLVSLVGVFTVTLIALNAMLNSIVIRPVMQLSRIADQISKGRVDGEELPVKGKDEIAMLSNSFNRMQRSLKEAMRLLGDS